MLLATFVGWAVLLERLLENVGLDVEPFATCGVASGWRLRLPPQNLVALHFVLKGQGRLGAGRGGTLELTTHTLAVVPPGLPHFIEVGQGRFAETRASAPDASGLSHLRAGPEQLESLRIACGHLRAMWAGNRGLFDTLTTPLVVSFGDHPRMREVFEALLAEQASEAPGRRGMMTALMQQCLVELFRRLCGHGDCHLPWLNALEDPRLARALQAIHAAPQGSHTLESLAGAAAMSRSAFATRFRELFGQTPMEYLREVRLREAARLLQQQELSVEAAAVRAGFASRSHFTRAFRRLFGKAPGAYRIDRREHPGSTRV